MKRAAQTIAMMAVAFLLAPGLYAGQSSSTSTSKVVAAVPPADSSPFPAAAAQHHHRDSDRSYPKVEWSLDYSFWRAMPTSRTNRIGYLHGGSTSVAYNFNNYLGLVADFGGFDNDHLTLFGPTTSQNYNANGSVFT